MILRLDRASCAGGSLGEETSSVNCARFAIIVVGRQCPYPLHGVLSCLPANKASASHTFGKEFNSAGPAGNGSHAPDLSRLGMKPQTAALPRRLLSVMAMFRCAVKRRWSTAGRKARPGTGSLHPVAIGAAVEATKPPEPSDVEGRTRRLGESAGRNVSKR